MALQVTACQEHLHPQAVEVDGGKSGRWNLAQVVNMMVSDVATRNLSQSQGPMTESMEHRIGQQEVKLLLTVLLLYGYDLLFRHFTTILIPLYFHNINKDSDNQGNIRYICSKIYDCL